MDQKTFKRLSRKETREQQKACKRPSREETKKEHQARLAHRRLRQLERRPGFTPIRNARVDSAIQAQEMMLQASGAYNAVEAHHEARRRVARMLPPPPMVRSYRRPSKSDDPDYRRGDGR